MNYPTYLIHYGTLGQKWGVRKYQNEDGTWTEEGLRRRRKYVSDSGDLTRSGKKYYKKLQKEKDKTQNLFLRNSGTLVYLQNSLPFESESEKEYNDRWFKKVFNETVKNVEYSKVIDSELSAIGQKYLAKTKGLEKSIDDVFIKTDKNGEKSIHFKVNEDNKEKKTKEETKEETKVGIDINNAKDIDNLQSDIEWAHENYEFREELLNEIYPKIEKSLDNVDILESSSKIWWLKENEASDFFKNNKRINDATNLAMKALGDDIEKYTGYTRNLIDSDKPTKYTFLLNSFNYPDETRASGLVQIADLVNQGYTKDQINNIMKVSYILQDDFYSKTKQKGGENRIDTLYSIGAYSSGQREKFIDKCIELKGNQLSDAKQSRIKSLIASGKSQEEVAKMLGVSTSTVNKYK